MTEKIEVLLTDKSESEKITTLTKPSQSVIKLVGSTDRVTATKKTLQELEDAFEEAEAEEEKKSDSDETIEENDETQQEMFEEGSNDDEYAIDDAMNKMKKADIALADTDMKPEAHFS
jgi:hypothetical protein